MISFLSYFIVENKTALKEPLMNEMFYGRSWQNVSIDEFIKILDDYMHWYAEERIKISLGGISPIQYRRQLGLTA